MRDTKIRFFLAFSIYVLVFLIILILSRPAGDKLVFYKDQKSLDYPIVTTLPSPRWEEFIAHYESPGPKTTHIVLPRIEAQGIELYVNWRREFKIGGPENNVKLRAKTFSIPVNLKAGDNVIVLRIWTLSRLSITVPVFISDNPTKYLIVSDALFCWFPGIMAASILMMGVLFLVVGHRLAIRRYFFSYMGLALLFIGIHLFHYTYIPCLSDIALYTFFNKLLLASLFISISFYYPAMETLVGRLKTWRWVMIYGLISASFIMFSPNLYKALRFSLWIIIPLFILLITYGFAKLIHFRNFYFTVPTIILVIASLHSYTSYLFNFNIQPIFVFGVSYKAYSFLHFLITELEFLNREREKVYLDPLTGAFNRRKLRELTLENGDVIVFFDIDDLKEYNDKRGHDFGDMALIDFVKVVKRNIKGKDVLVRYGGDEFIVVMRDCKESDAREVASSIDKEYRKEVGLGVSFGISLYKGDLFKAIKEADKKMYEMKRERKHI